MTTDMKHSYARLNCPRPDNCHAESVEEFWTLDTPALRGTAHHGPDAEPVEPQKLWLDDLARRRRDLLSAIES